MTHGLSHCAVPWMDFPKEWTKMQSWQTLETLLKNTYTDRMGGLHAVPRPAVKKSTGGAGRDLLLPEITKARRPNPIPLNGLARGAGLGGVCASSCRRGLHRRLLRLCRSRVAVRSGPSRLRIARHRDFELLAQNVFQFVPNILVF